MEFESNIKWLKIIGVWVSKKPPPFWLRIWGTFILLIYSLSIFLVVINIYVDKKLKTHTKIENFFELTKFSVILFTLHHYSTRRKEYLRILDIYDGIFTESGKEAGKAVDTDTAVSEIKMKQRAIRIIRRSNKIILVYVIILISSLAFTVTMIMGFEAEGKTRYLKYHVWWPSNPRTGFWYYVIIAFQSAGVHYHLAVPIASDAFICALLICASTVSDLLTETAAKALRYDPAMPNKLSALCRSWLRKHQDYLTLIDHLNTVKGILLCVDYSFISLSIVFLTYNIVKLGTKNIIGTTFMVVTGVVIRLALLSSAGQRVIDSNSCLKHTIMAIVQYELSGLPNRPMRSALQVLATRTSIIEDRHSRISAYGFFNVSTGLMSSVLRGTVTYILFLLQFNAPGPKDEAA